jgi:hypothetical protein
VDVWFRDGRRLRCTRGGGGSRTGGRRHGRGTHTRSARSGHRLQDSATLEGRVRHTCL